MLAVDLSNYTSALTQQGMQAWKDAGVGKVIVQSLNPPPGYPVGKTIQQIDEALNFGFIVDAYVWLWFDLDDSDIQNKLNLISTYEGSISSLWLDVEDTAATKYSQQVCEDKVQSALELCDTFRVKSEILTGIYTGKWFWSDPRYMVNTSKFRDRRLWDSNYDLVPNLDVGFRSYGGWTHPTIKQYKGTSSLGGISGLDLNVLEDIVSDPNQQPPRETPDDYPYSTWRESAIAYRGALDQMGQENDQLKKKIQQALGDLS